MIPRLDFIGRGQIWAIAGDSGSGNSTLLQALDGKDAERVPMKHQFRSLSNIADFYYQQRFNSSDAADSPTVQQHLDKHNAGRGSWSVENVVGRLQLRDLLNEQLIKLSNGETRRVLIASALLRNPALLLLDHPLTGLDAATREGLSDLFIDIADSGITVIVACSIAGIPDSVTHVAWMENGKIVFHGNKQAFFDQPFARAAGDESVVDAGQVKDLLFPPSPRPYKIIVDMNNVTVRYDGKVILDQVNWRVLPGERWSLTGPNGAGKSTLLSLINADNPQAYANDIVLFDRPRGSGESIWDIKKQTGFVSPELYQYFPTDSTCHQIIESGFYDTIGLFRASNPQKAAHALAWMQLLRINSYGSWLFSRVPHDVQRLCLLARALVKNPPLLILDEPTQGLDYRQQKFFTALIDHICRHSDITLIFVSHYPDHIPAAVSRHLQLQNGKMRIEGH